MRGREDWESVLREEFNAEDDSFLLVLRVRLIWDETAFQRLTEVMAAACAATQGDDQVDRWLADGFWYLSWFPRSWVGHPSLRHDGDRKSELEQLDALAAWFFGGESEAPSPPSGRTA